MSKPLAVVCDIDGVIADSWWRGSHIWKKDQDWEAFYEDCGKDPALPMLKVLERLSSDMHLKIFFVTNRPESNRSLTNEWFTKQDFIDNPGMTRLLMRPDTETKFWKLNKVRELLTEYEVIAIFEDDPQIALPLMRQGLPVVPIHSGYYEWPSRSGV
jgi:predicted secreted acid phosphatase